MNFTSLYLILSLLSALALTGAQFAFPYEGGDTCAPAKLFDPFLIQILKSKQPKKYGAKFGFDKDSVLQAKYKLAIGKLLARHWKNVNAANFEMPNVACEQQHSATARNLFPCDQSAQAFAGRPTMPTSDIQIPCALRTVAQDFCGGYPGTMDQRLLHSDCQFPRHFV